MAQTAAQLVERVIPWVPIRQWVVSVPVPLRYWMAASQELTAKVHTIIRTTIGQYYVNQAVTTGVPRAKVQPGSVTFIQRFGSAINLHIHFRGHHAQRGAPKDPLASEARGGPPPLPQRVSAKPSSPAPPPDCAWSIPTRPRQPSSGPAPVVPPRAAGGWGGLSCVLPAPSTRPVAARGQDPSPWKCPTRPHAFAPASLGTTGLTVHHMNQSCVCTCPSPGSVCTRLSLALPLSEPPPLQRRRHPVPRSPGCPCPAALASGAPRVCRGGGDGSQWRRGPRGRPGARPARASGAGRAGRPQHQQEGGQGAR
jgi:hypothetical protein